MSISELARLSLIDMKARAASDKIGVDARKNIPTRNTENIQLITEEQKEEYDIKNPTIIMEPDAPDLEVYRAPERVRTALELERNRVMLEVIANEIDLRERDMTRIRNLQREIQDEINETPRPEKFYLHPERVAYDERIAELRAMVDEGDDFIRELRRQIAEYLTYRQMIELDIRENDNRKSINQGELMRTIETNKKRIKQFQEELNLTNRGQFNASQAPSETEEQFLRRLQESVQQAKPDRQQVAANYIEKDFRRNLKQVMKTDTVNEIVNIYRGIDGFTKQAMVNMFWTEIKEKYIKRFGINNKYLSANQVAELLDDTIEELQDQMTARDEYRLQRILETFEPSMAREPSIVYEGDIPIGREIIIGEEIQEDDEPYRIQPDNSKIGSRRDRSRSQSRGPSSKTKEINAELKELREMRGEDRRSGVLRRDEERAEYEREMKIKGREDRSRRAKLLDDAKEFNNQTKERQNMRIEDYDIGDMERRAELESQELESQGLAPKKRVPNIITPEYIEPTKQKSREPSPEPERAVASLSDDRYVFIVSKKGAMLFFRVLTFSGKERIVVSKTGEKDTFRQIFAVRSGDGASIPAGSIDNASLIVNNKISHDDLTNIFGSLKNKDVINRVSSQRFAQRYGGVLRYTIDGITAKQTKASEPERIHVGWGIKTEDIPNKCEFGAIIILLHKLVHNQTLAIKRKNGSNITGFPNIKVSEKMVRVIMEILQGKNPSHLIKDLTETEQHIFSQLIHLSKLLTIDNKKEATILALKNQYDVLCGEIQGGNDNPKLLRECRQILNKMCNFGLITQHDVLTQMHSLGA